MGKMPISLLVNAWSRQLAAVLVVLASGCTTALPRVDTPTVPPLAGQVDFGTPRKVAATMQQIGEGATVSLIDPVSGNTISTALTSPAGAFLLTFSNNFSPQEGPYFLEGVKGLPVGGAFNRVGAPLARVRTLVSFQGQWKSLSAGGIIMSKTTTAISALSNLKGLSASQNLALIGKVRPKASSLLDGITTPDSFTPTADISDLEYHRTWKLVDGALLQDADPIAALFLRPADATASATSSLGPAFGFYPGIAWGSDGMALLSLDPATGSAGSTVTLRGQGLPTASASIQVWLPGAGGGMINCPVLSASADGSSITFRVGTAPALGAVSVEVRYGPWTNSRLALTVE
ncbi:MAG: hypothetical protein HY692_00875 [Cyanobacteria bacterium NC_groundwater_1444_Ag_S-0.65um_54_12]|nr:hypothetical protein [Cyanobacteria bacterium NC_groundwater_1444_Ag_S-0.65um_54_12]